LKPLNFSGITGTAHKVTVPVAICVGIDFGAISSMTRLPIMRRGQSSDRMAFVEASPAVHLAHRDLTRSQQSPEHIAAVSAEGSTVWVLIAA